MTLSLVTKRFTLVTNLNRADNLQSSTKTMSVSLELVDFPAGQVDFVGYCSTGNYSMVENFHGSFCH